MSENAMRYFLGDLTTKQKTQIACPDHFAYAVNKVTGALKDYPHIKLGMLLEKLAEKRIVLSKQDFAILRSIGMEMDFWNDARQKYMRWIDTLTKEEYLKFQIKELTGE